MYRNIKAENIQLRVPLAFKIDEHADAVFGTAYKRIPGVITVALATKQHVDLRLDERAFVSYTPEDEPNVKAIRRCGKCEVPHLRRILTDKHATAYCDASAKLFRENAKDGVSERAKAHEAKVDAREERLSFAINRVAKTRGYLIAVALRNAAKFPGRFDAVAKGYGLSHEEATEAVNRYFELVEA